MLLQGHVAAVVCEYTSDTLKTIEVLRKRHAELIICVLSLRGDVPLEQLQKLGVTYRSKALNSPEKFFNYSNNFYINKIVLMSLSVSEAIDVNHSGNPEHVKCPNFTVR